ncbi:IPT/TIG domain-containing protein [Actinoplanes ianthinogenes]|nr:IPT/TIG domain-containing protein [Actinoplanes ianthinogenes]
MKSRIAGFAAVTTIALTGVSAAAYATEEVTLTPGFTNGIAAKATGGTVIPVTVTGGTVGDTPTAYSALRITAKVGGVNAVVAWVDATHLRVTAPATPRATNATMQLFSKGVGGPESSATVAYAPVVTTAAPARISTDGGATVAISGAGFLGVSADNPSAVTFGSTPATSFTVDSATKITAVAPPGTNGAATIIVTSEGGASEATAKGSVLYRAPLGVDLSGDPAVKASGGPLVLAVTGGTLGDTPTAFAAEAVTVKLGTRSLAAAYVDAGHLKVTLPAVTTATAQVTVVHDTIAGEPAEVTVVPVVTALSAKTDTVAGGTTVTAKLAGVDVATATDFAFGDNPADCSRVGTTVPVTFSCTVPAATTAGPTWFHFIAGNGQASRFTAAAAFSYTDN